MRYFADRIDAGKRLAAALKGASKEAIVLAVPRGGVVVGYEVAHALGIPLDVLITKKIGAPDNPELAIGAVAEDGTTILDDELARRLRVSEEYVREEIERQRLEIKRRLIAYRGDVPYPRLENHEVILVDDGVATGSTLKASLKLLRKKGAKPIAVAVPVGPQSTVGELKREADRVVCLYTPEPFYAIGEFYEDFAQTNDEEVTRLLRLNRQELQTEKVTK